MSKGKESKTFFEVFSMQSKGKDAETQGAPEEGPQIPAPTQGEDLVVISDVTADTPGRKRWGGSFNVNLATIILASVGGVCLAVGCFFIGHKLGLDKAFKDRVVKKEAILGKGTTEQPKAQQVSPAKAKVGQVRPSNATAVTAPAKPQVATPERLKWSLRVVSYKNIDKNLEKATHLATLLQDRMGHSAFVAKLGSQIVVCLGEFDSKNNTQLHELQKQLKDFKFENKKQFAGCYPVQVR